MTRETAPGALMLDLSGTTLTSSEGRLLERACVGGVILFSRNYQSPEQVRTLIASLRQCNPHLLVAVDQEGGRVQRFRNGFTRLPSLASFGELYERDQNQALEAAQQAGWLMAAELLAVGVDISFAPVLDLGLPISQVIGRRGFASKPEVVSHLAQAYIAGMHDAGMAATGKHFPGHGSVEADSHTHLPVDGRTLEQLQAADLIPFRDCASVLDAIMPAHVIYGAVDRLCAGFSKFWLQDILRQQLRFEGVIFSDDLTMAAAHSAGTVEQRAALALQAGCDMVLVCNNPELAVMVAEWLDATGHQGSPRLRRMQRRAEYDSHQLRHSDRWHSAAAVMAGLVEHDRS